jgi:hypothetical protein
MPDLDLTLTANWTANKYTVDLHSDSHSELVIVNPIGQNEYEYNSDVEVRVNITNAQYVLDSLTSEQVTLTKKTDGLYVFKVPANDVVITLQTKPIDYKITCRLNGGEFEQ